MPHAPQRTTPSPPLAEVTTERIAWLGALPGVSDPDESDRSARWCRPWRIGRVWEHWYPGSSIPQRCQGQQCGQRASVASKYASTTQVLVVRSSANGANPGQHWQMTSHEAIPAEIYADLLSISISREPSRTRLPGAALFGLIDLLRWYVASFCIKVRALPYCSINKFDGE
jgi:hypothetical protein